MKKGLFLAFVITIIGCNSKKEKIQKEVLLNQIESLNSSIDFQKENLKYSILIFRKELLLLDTNHNSHYYKYQFFERLEKVKDNTNIDSFKNILNDYVVALINKNNNYNATERLKKDCESMDTMYKKTFADCDILDDTLYSSLLKLKYNLNVVEYIQCSDVRLFCGYYDSSLSFDKDNNKLNIYLDFDSDYYNVLKAYDKNNKEVASSMTGKIQLGSISNINVNNVSKVKFIIGNKRTHFVYDSLQIYPL